MLRTPVGNFSGLIDLWAAGGYRIQPVRSAKSVRIIHGSKSGYRVV
jgi:hypothetical protein